MFRLLPETPGDADEVEALLDLTFAPGRKTLSSYRLRDGVPPVARLCRIARDEYDALAGCIRFWPALIGREGWPTLLLGPVAVHPTRQGEGLGAVLITDALEQAAALGWERCVLVGDEPYYRRFGFTREAAAEIGFPPPTNPARILARALVSGGLFGVKGDIRKAEGYE